MAHKNHAFLLIIFVSLDRAPIEDQLKRTLQYPRDEQRDKLKQSKK